MPRPSRRHVSLVAALAWVCHASLAAAQTALPPLPPLPPPEPIPAPPPPVEPAPPPPYAPAPPPDDVPPPPPQPPVEPSETPPEAEPAQNPADARFTDAHVDRVILGSTAETHPAGTVFFTDYELLLLQLGVAVTDSLQLSVASVVPVADGQPLFLDVGAKLNVARGRVFRAALMASFDALGGLSDGTTGLYLDGRFGPVGQLCFEATCRSSMSFSAGTIAASGTGGGVPIYGAVGVIGNVSSVVSLLAETAAAGMAGESSSSGYGTGNAAGLALDYGVRLSGKNFGADLTFVAPVVSTSGPVNNPFVLGYPFVVFTYRTDGTAKPR
jgi:hypothetical protein